MNSSIHATFFSWVDYGTHTEPIMRYAMNEAIERNKVQGRKAMRRLIFWIWKNAKFGGFGCSGFCLTCPHFDKCSQDGMEE